MRLEAVIGLEIHIQLKTKSKMFCSCSNMGENEPPNTAICPICLGHPGTLPVLNLQALKLGIKAGLALGCDIPHFSKFDRKNYFYPDLPKGYQISQYDEPIAINGSLIIKVPKTKNQTRSQVKIGITRAHLEEDAAKLIHSKDKKYSLVDYNRGGTPLLEIVTEPDFKTPLEAKIFLQELRLIMRYLNTSDADMEKGQLRCDANISLRELKKDKSSKAVHRSETSAKIEVKNMNSFKAVERALEYEIKRQTKLWQEVAPPKIQTTRGWDDEQGITIKQRSKEEAHDYRYFPEPDLPPLHLKELAKTLADTLEELPAPKRIRFAEEYGFNASDAYILTGDKALANYTEKVISELRAWINDLEETEGTHEEIWQTNKKKLIKLASGWLVNRYAKLLEDKKINAEQSKITPENFAELLTLVYQNKINSSVAQKILELMFVSGIDPSYAIEEQGLEQISDESELEIMVEKVIKNYPKQVAEFKAGKEAVLKFLIGMVMKESKGKANPQIAGEMLKKKI